MPVYDFECPHGHRFEKSVRIADRGEAIPCEGKVNRLLTDDELDELKLALEGRPVDEPMIVAADVEWVPITPDSSNGDPVERMAVIPVPCILKASRVEISFSGSNKILDHGSASNRDAAREGRYDPLNPNRRFMAKGRSWRK
jgi:hypothetical protein